MLFSCGMPILYLIGSILFTVKYFGDKYVLLRQSRKTGKLDSTLNNWICLSLRMALWGHAAISLMTLTVQDIFKPTDMSDLTAIAHS